jgi:hypothetical protein
LACLPCLPVHHYTNSHRRMAWCIHDRPPTPLILQRFAREAGGEKPPIARLLPVSPSIFSQNQRDIDFFGCL